MDVMAPFTDKVGIAVDMGNGSSVAQAREVETTIDNYRSPLAQFKIAHYEIFSMQQLFIQMLHVPV
jgi:hypothetical protein